jgi:hypothetical protein
MCEVLLGLCVCEYVPLILCVSWVRARARARLCVCVCVCVCVCFKEWRLSLPSWIVQQVDVQRLLSHPFTPKTTCQALSLAAAIWIAPALERYC